MRMIIIPTLYAVRGLHEGMQKLSAVPDLSLAFDMFVASTIVIVIDHIWPKFWSVTKVHMLGLPSGMHRPACLILILPATVSRKPSLALLLMHAMPPLCALCFHPLEIMFCSNGCSRIF